MTLALDLFITHLFSDDQQARLFFISVLVTVVFSVILHELAHGLAAIRLGDDTPIHTGHMNFNPIVHMGPMSLLALCVVGIAWGAMPISPYKIRGRYGEALVAVAGPVTNLLLALIALTILGIWMPDMLTDQDHFTDNLSYFIFVFGSTNVMLFLFNLFPVPPLDGSRILATFHRGYANFIYDPSRQGVMMLGFIFVFMIASQLWDPVDRVATQYVWWITELTR
ncbi:MAG: site-2 protease family protein [Planctomycetaceae bacterium]|nr:site-2 protease family protein [Planctomycetaceae bacterium]